MPIGAPASVHSPRSFARVSGPSRILTCASASGPPPMAVTTTPERRPSPTRRRWTGASVPRAARLFDGAAPARRTGRVSESAPPALPPRSGPCVAPRPATRQTPRPGRWHWVNDPFAAVVGTSRGHSTLESTALEDKLEPHAAHRDVAGRRDRPAHRERHPRPWHPESATDRGHRQIAACRRAGEGMARSARTGRSPTMFTSRSSGSIPSESSMGCKNPSM